VALAPWFVAVARTTPGRALASGALWGLAAALGLSWWFPGTVAGYFHQSYALGWLAFLAFSVASASLYYGPFAAWLSWLACRGVANPLVVAAGWGATEFARAHLLLADPWGLSGYSQVGWPALMQIADATGPYGPGFLIGGVNACLAALREPALRGRHPWLSALAIAAAVGGAIAYGQWRLVQEQPAGDAFTVAIVQGAGRPDGDTSAQPASRLARYLDLTATIAGSAPQLVVWPESAVDFYVEDDSSQRRSLLEASRAFGATELLIGGLGRTTRRGTLRPHNSAFLLRDGRIVGRYHKTILYPVAERPLPGISGGSGLAPGDAPAPLPSAHGPLAAVVCVEAMHPAYVRGLARPSGLLVNMSNDAWFAHPVPAAHQLAITSVRAIENRRWLVRASASGYSAVIDPTGHVVARTTFGQPDTLVAQVHWRDDVTPYQRWGDAPAWSMVTLAIAATLRAWLKRR